MPTTRAAVPAPMLATPGRPPIGTGWAVEMKWDGARTVAVCDGERCRLYSRNSKDDSGVYPESTIALSAVSRRRTMVVDGEIVAPDPRSGAPLTTDGCSQADFQPKRYIRRRWQNAYAHSAFPPEPPGTRP
ncbi:ATP-dependent DNA ligase [Rhodococcus sp. 2H158]